MNPKREKHHDNEQKVEKHTLETIVEKRTPFDSKTGGCGGFGGQIDGMRSNYLVKSTKIIIFAPMMS
jgi:hypothetical protein